MTPPDPIVVARPVDRNDQWFAARMTNVQFNALAVRLAPDIIMAQLPDVVARRRTRHAAQRDIRAVRQWLTNGWNTEHLLAVNATYLSGATLNHSLHWAFAQAYYSVYAVTIACFKALGYTEESHTALIRRFGFDAAEGRYPAAIACTVDGVRPWQHGQLCAVNLPTSPHFDPTVPEAVDGQIAQLLRATRVVDLRNKKAAMGIRTRLGRRKRAFAAADWLRVSETLGPTSLLSFLYRKRIKAHYQDIDTFLHPELDAKALYQHISRVVGALNFVHETLLAKSLGMNVLAKATTDLPAGVRKKPLLRASAVRRLIE